MIALEMCWPIERVIPDGDARTVSPLKSKLLPGYSEHEDVDVAAVLKAKEAERIETNRMQRLKYHPPEQKTPLKIARAIERRNRIIQHLAMHTDWMEGKRIGRELSIDQHTLYADLTVMRNSHVLEWRESRRPDGRGTFKAYRVPV